MSTKKTTKITKVKKINTNAAGEAVPNVNIHVAPPAAEKSVPVNRAKIGHFVAGVICTVLAMVATGLAIWICLRYLGADTTTADGVAKLIVFLLFGLGVAAFLPALILSITGIACSAIAVKSNKTAIRTFSIIFLIFSILTLILVVFLPFIMPLFFTA